MTASYQYLLSLDPLAALVRMVNDQNGTNYRLDGFTASDPIAIGDTATQVTLTGVPRPTSFSDEYVQGSLPPLTYDRLDLNVFLRGVLTGWTTALPASTQNVLDEITALMGQKFYIDDIVLTEITRDNGAAYALTAKPNSLRFVGQIVLPLVNLTPMSSLMDANALASIVDNSQVTFPLSVSTPYLNATDFRTIASGFAVGDLAQDKANLVTLFNSVVPDPASNNNFAEAPWYVSTTPGPFNLYNCQVVEYDGGEGVNAAIPTLESSLIVRLDGNYCTNFQTGDVVIPYMAQNFELDGYTAFPRCIANSIVSLSDGTAWNVYLNSFQAGQVINSFQYTPAITMDGPNQWTATPGVPSPTNLYGATVVYNGQLRSTDLPAATQGLDRVLVVDMGIDNSVWQGNYRFYYASPIPLTWKGFPQLNGTVGSYFQQDFTPSGGDGPFTYATSGTLPPGLSFSGSVLSGTLTTAGSFSFGVTITDTNGTAVLFTPNLLVGTQIAPLTLTGSLPNAVVNTPYLAFLDIHGGIAPYSGAGVVSGSLPPGLTAQLQYNTIRISGTPTQIDSYPVAIGVQSADGQSVSSSFTIVVGDTYPPLQITGTYSEGVVGASYDSSLYITGGSGVYSAVGLYSGTLPPGLALNYSTIGAPQLMLEGTPTQQGTYSFTVQAYSSDGQTAYSPQTVTIVAG